MIGGLLQIGWLATFVSLFVFVFATVLVPKTFVEQYALIVLLWSLRAVGVLFALRLITPRPGRRKRNELPCRF